MQASEEVYLVNLDSSYHSLNAPSLAMEHTLGISDPFANMTVYHLTDFSNPDVRARRVAFSGVQLTRTRLWMIWDLALLKRAVMHQRHTGRLRSGSREREEPGVSGATVPCECIGQITRQFMMFIR